jgi:hypothetical protein
VCELLPGKCVEQPEILGVILFTDEAVWPPSSPDLNPCDFFFMGAFKTAGLLGTPVNNETSGENCIN